MYTILPAAQNDNRAFFTKLKEESERLWEDLSLRRYIYGFQIQPGTKWLPGLSEAEINDYESILGFGFPQVYRDFLSYMNGTDKEAVNIYGDSGSPYRYGPGYYSYPRDLEDVVDRILWIYDEFGVTPADVEEKAIPHILPVVSHRFLVADNCDSNPVLSMYGTDVIVYARDLRTFLVNDILHEHAFDEAIPITLTVEFWLDERW